MQGQIIKETNISFGTLGRSLIYMLNNAGPNVIFYKRVIRRA
jgi:hypothetical protein